MSKCECKVVRKFSFGSKKLMHSLRPADRANKHMVTTNEPLDGMGLELMHVSTTPNI